MTKLADTWKQVTQFNDFNSLKSEWRSIKIELLESEHIFVPNPSLIKKKNWFKNQPYWKFLSNQKNAIITGSVAFKAYGLLNRQTKDLDLFLPSQDVNNYNLNRKKERLAFGSRRYNDTSLSMIAFGRINGSDIDIFEQKNTKYVESEGFKFHSLVDLIDSKVNLAHERVGSKDFVDLCVIFGMIRNKINTAS